MLVMKLMFNKYLIPVFFYVQFFIINYGWSQNCGLPHTPIELDSILESVKSGSFIESIRTVNIETFEYNVACQPESGGNFLSTIPQEFFHIETFANNKTTNLWLHSLSNLTTLVDHHKIVKCKVITSFKCTDNKIKSTTFIIKLKDLNNRRPKFDRREYNLTVQLPWHVEVPLNFDMPIKIKDDDRDCKNTDVELRLQNNGESSHTSSFDDPASLFYISSRLVSNHACRDENPKYYGGIQAEPEPPPPPPPNPGGPEPEEYLYEANLYLHEHVPLFELAHLDTVSLIATVQNKVLGYDDSIMKSEAIINIKFLPAPLDLNLPKFEQHIYDCKILNLNTDGIKDLKINANDPDRLTGIRYEIVEATGGHHNKMKQLIQINSTSGDLSFTRDLDISDVDGFGHAVGVFQIKAVQLDTDLRYSSVTLLVYFEFDEDFSPPTTIEPPTTTTMITTTTTTPTTTTTTTSNPPTDSTTTTEQATIPTETPPGSTETTTEHETIPTETPSDSTTTQHSTIPTDTPPDTTTTEHTTIQTETPPETTTTEQQTYPTETPTESTTDPGRGFCYGLDDDNYANPDDCGSFYQCAGNITYLIYCPTDPQLYFNPVPKVCDFPANVPGCPPPATTGPTSTTQAHPITTESMSTTNNEDPPVTRTTPFYDTEPSVTTISYSEGTTEFESTTIELTTATTPEVNTDEPTWTSTVWTTEASATTHETSTISTTDATTDEQTQTSTWRPTDTPGSTSMEQPSPTHGTTTSDPEMEHPSTTESEPQLTTTEMSNPTTTDTPTITNVPTTTWTMPTSTTPFSSSTTETTTTEGISEDPIEPTTEISGTTTTETLIPTSSTERPPGPGFKCPEIINGSGKNFPDVQFCNRYYSCRSDGIQDQGVISESMCCSTDLYLIYCWETDSCIHPDEIVEPCLGCRGLFDESCLKIVDSSTTPTATETTQTPPVQTTLAEEEFECPEDLPIAGQNYPDPKYCNRYYSCRSENSHVNNKAFTPSFAIKESMCCPIGPSHERLLTYCATIDQCVYKENTEANNCTCKVDTFDDSCHNETRPTTITTTMIPVTEPEEQLICPEPHEIHDDDELGHEIKFNYPHPTYCNRFLTCQASGDGGQIPTSRCCAPGLDSDPYLTYCKKWDRCLNSYEVELYNCACNGINDPTCLENVNENEYSIRI